MLLRRSDVIAWWLWLAPTRWCWCFTAGVTSEGYDAGEVRLLALKAVAVMVVVVVVVVGVPVLLPRALLLVLFTLDWDAVLWLLAFDEPRALFDTGLERVPWMLKKPAAEEMAAPTAAANGSAAAAAVVGEGPPVVVLLLLCTTERVEPVATDPRLSSLPVSPAEEASLGTSPAQMPRRPKDMGKVLYVLLCGCVSRVSGTNSCSTASAATVLMMSSMPSTSSPSLPW